MNLPIELVTMESDHQFSRQIHNRRMLVLIKYFLDMRKVSNQSKLQNKVEKRIRDAAETVIGCVFLFSKAGKYWVRVPHNKLVAYQPYLLEP